MRLEPINIKPAQQPMKLLFGKRDDLSVIFTRPFKFLFLQALVPQTKATAIPVQYFYFVSLLVTKNKQA
jgi:hypothetical protein